MQQRRHHPQVAGHRRLQREQGEQPLVDLQVAPVEAVVVGDDDRGELDVLVLERLQRAVQGRHDHVQRAQRLVLERAQLVLEAEPVGLARHQPNLPVT